MAAPTPPDPPAPATPVAQVAAAAVAPPTRWRRLRRLGLWYAVAAGSVFGLALSAWSPQSVRVGGYVVAASLALGGLLRAVRPQPRVGGLAVRRRWIDVISWVGLAVAVAVAFTLVRH